MSKAKRLFCAAAAAVMLLVCVTGCSAPKLTIGGTAKEAGTVDGTAISTGEYLAYLYTTFSDLYYNQGLYQYEAYGYDIWSQTYSYGEGDDAEELELADYIIRTTQDGIVRQAAVDDLLEKYGLSWIEEDEAEVDKELESLGENAYLDLGISDENFIKVYKAMSLSESSLFYGLYGEGGEREMSEADRKAYFDENYISFKAITVSMVDSEGNEYSEADQKKTLSDLDKYLQNYNSSGNFEAVVDQYNKANAAEGEEVTASKDEDNRVNADATQLGDDEMVKAIRGVDIGKAKVVTYKSGGTTLTAALVLRLDPHDPATLFEDETDNIIYGAKYEAFNEEVEKEADALTAEFKKSVVKKCDPKNFVETAE